PLSYLVTQGPQTYNIELTGAGGPNGGPRAEGPRVGLHVGQRAPDLDGLDLDGKAFKLSDYRGQVVLVYFWGHWCNLCREQYPQMRALSERYRGQRFVLLGVNSDGEREDSRRAVREHALPMRSWWDGDIDGEAARTWEVKGWPTFYLLDGDGVIQARNVLGAD